jgi:pimeloyl-ACP methyl ester carboxylesterase
MHAHQSGRVLVNGLRLHYLEWSGGGPAVLCLPGITANAHAFAGLAEELSTGSPRDRVVAMDLRGRGESDKPPTGYTMADHVADAAGVLAALGITRAIVIGWSLGAKIGLALAAAHPALVERLVLLDPPVETPDATVVALRAFWARLDNTYLSVDEFLKRMHGSPVFKEGTPYVERYLRADVEGTPDGVVKHRVPRWVPEAELAGEAIYPTRSFYSRIACPTLVLRAPRPLVREGDQVLPVADSREMAAAIADCQLIEVDGADHFSILLGKPRQTLEAINRFITNANHERELSDEHTPIRLTSGSTRHAQRY